jgi:hypothetical protein
VDHPRGAHDDYAISACGALHLAPLYSPLVFTEEFFALVETLAGAVVIAYNPANRSIETRAKLWERRIIPDTARLHRMLYHGVRETRLRAAEWYQWVFADPLSPPIGAARVSG